MSRVRRVGGLVAALFALAAITVVLAESSWIANLPFMVKHWVDVSPAAATATATVTTTVSPTPTYTPTAVVTCTEHSAALMLTSSAATVKSGETFTVTARLHNTGCGMLGLPLYRLRWEDSAPSLLTALSPTEVTHYRGILYGEHDEAVFYLQAVLAGQLTLRCTVSFEVHLGYPGPAYWSGAGAAPLRLEIAP